VLNIVVALKAEAAPLIEGLSLVRRVENTGYPVYSGPCAKLGISGLGSNNARELTRLLLNEEDSGHRNNAGHWLNFGIAGSVDRNVGDLVQAHLVTEVSTGQSWKLGARDVLHLSAAHIYTVQAPQLVYQNNRVYDMEVAGMLSVLSDRGLLGRTSSLKLISDGPGTPANTLRKNDIHQLIQNRKKDILTAVKTLYPEVS
jgi:hypothetical protein